MCQNFNNDDDDEEDDEDGEEDDEADDNNIYASKLIRNKYVRMASTEKIWLTEIELCERERASQGEGEQR